jgi:hypothetical protein
MLSDKGQIYGVHGVCHDMHEYTHIQTHKLCFGKPNTPLTQTDQSLIPRLTLSCSNCDPR